MPPLDIGINLVTISDARLGIDPERSVILDRRLHITMITLYEYAPKYYACTIRLCMCALKYIYNYTSSTIIYIL